MSPAKEKVLTRFSDVVPEPIDWLWPGRLAAGKLTLLDGDPAQGKSFITVDIAARLSTGRALPDGFQPSAACPVVILAAEDRLSDTLIPRLRSAGSDLEKIHEFRRRGTNGQPELPTFPDDCDLLGQTIQETQARLVIIDPFLAFLSAGACSLNNHSIRQGLLPVARVAEETRAAILLVRHLTKLGRGMPALHRGLGAVAIIGAARTSFLAASHPEDPGLHLLACTKTNLTVPPPTLVYRIQTGDAGGTVEWAGTSPLLADDLAGARGRADGEALAHAEAFLREMLAEGEQPAEFVTRQAQGNGISERTLSRAKKELKIISAQSWETGRRVWYWRLKPDPESEQQWRELCEGDDPSKTVKPGVDNGPIAE